MPRWSIRDYQGSLKTAVANACFERVGVSLQKETAETPSEILARETAEAPREILAQETAEALREILAQETANLPNLPVETQVPETSSHQPPEIADAPLLSQTSTVSTRSDKSSDKSQLQQKRRSSRNSKRTRY